jgi:hypothetical protein
MAVETERVKQLSEKFLRKELYVIISTPSGPHSESTPNSAMLNA